MQDDPKKITLFTLNFFEDKRMLFNVTYKDGNYKLVDKLGIHFAEDDGTWSPALPLCNFPQEEIEHMIESIEVTLNKAI